MSERLMDAKELGERLGVKTETIRHWARQGLIPSIKATPKVIRFDYDEVVVSLRKTKE